MKDAMIALVVAAAVSAVAATGYAETLREAGPPPEGTKTQMPLAEGDGAKEEVASAPLAAPRSARAQSVGDAEAGAVTDGKARKQ